MNGKVHLPYLFHLAGDSWRLKKWQRWLLYLPEAQASQYTAYHTWYLRLAQPK